MSYDPLSISNTVLDLAEERALPLRCHDLQRIVYFAHGINLTKTGLPLVSGCFEAWRNGPVHPVIYLSFCRAGEDVIDFRASRQRTFSGLRSEVPPVTDRAAIDLLLRVVSPEIGGSPLHLSHLARAENAPWHHVVSRARETKSVSFRITNSCIIERFAFHKANAADDGDDVLLIDAPFSFQDFAGEIGVPA